MTYFAILRTSGKIRVTRTSSGSAPKSHHFALRPYSSWMQYIDLNYTFSEL